MPTNKGKKTVKSAGFWMGRPIEELSREELIFALTTMGNLYSRTLKDHAEDLDVLTKYRI